MILQKIPNFDTELLTSAPVEKAVESVHNFQYAMVFMALWKLNTKSIFGENRTFFDKNKVQSEKMQDFCENMFFLPLTLTKG